MKAALFLALILAAGNCSAQTVSSQVYPILATDTMRIISAPGIVITVSTRVFDQPFLVATPPTVSVSIVSPIKNISVDETFNVATTPTSSITIDTIVIRHSEDETFNVASSASVGSLIIETIVVRTNQDDNFNVATAPAVFITIN